MVPSRPKSTGEKNASLNTINPTSALVHIVGRGIDGIYRSTSADGENEDKEYDEDGNSIRPVSPLRRSMQPFESIADRMREKRKSWAPSTTSALSYDPDAPSRLLELPNELQFMIISYLDFGDLERMRRACRYYRLLLSPDYVRELFGGHAQLAPHLTTVCQQCLETPGRTSLILQPAPNRPSSQHAHAPRPVSSKCFQCAVKARDLRVGTAVPLASARTAWVCRWCGWPVVGPHSWANEQFHINCYDRYYRVLWVFMCLGFVQFAVGVVAATLSLRYFRSETVILAPTIINFVLLWVCMAFLMLRGNRIRTYLWVGIVELIILGLWIPPIYGVVKDLQRNPDREVFDSTIAALVFFALNIIFRLLNVVGNVVLMFEYDMTKHYVPQIPLRRRLMNLLMTGLIYWTYPQSVEQRYPPDFN